MLTKKQIDRKVHGYIKEHSSKHSKSSIKKALSTYGFDENYIEKRLRKHSEKELMKRYLATTSVLLLGLVFYFWFLEFGIVDGLQITGLAVIENPQANYLAINIEKMNESLKALSIARVNLKGIIGNQDGNFTIVVFGDDYSVIYESIYDLSRDGNHIIYVPNDKEINSMEIYENEKVVLEYYFD